MSAKYGTDPTYDEIEYLIDNDPIELGKRLRKAERQNEALWEVLTNAFQAETWDELRAVERACPEKPRHGVEREGFVSAQDAAIEAAAKAIHKAKCGCSYYGRHLPGIVRTYEADARLVLRAALSTLADDQLFRSDASVVRAESRVAFEGGDMSVLYALHVVEAS